jgi:hypothetical protein
MLLAWLARSCIRSGQQQSYDLRLSLLPNGASVDDAQRIRCRNCQLEDALSAEEATEDVPKGGAVDQAEEPSKCLVS